MEAVSFMRKAMLQKELQDWMMTHGCKPRLVLYGDGALMGSYTAWLGQHNCHVIAVCRAFGAACPAEVPEFSLAELSGRGTDTYDLVLITVKREGVAVVLQRRLELAGIAVEKILWGILQEDTKKEKRICIMVSHRTDLASVTVPNPLYVPVRCGAQYDVSGRSSLLGDDTGDHLSRMKPYLSELTVQYWAWKNIEADYYGLCHYRRFLSFSENQYPMNSRAIVMDPCLDEGAMERYGLLDQEHMRNIIEANDAVVNQSADVREILLSKGYMPTVYEHWAAHDGLFIDQRVLPVFVECIRKATPQFETTAMEYLRDCYYRGYNSFILTKKLFCDMCSFQQKVLSALWEQIKFSSMLRRYPRTLGYMGEILYGIFIHWMQEVGHYRIEKRQLVQFDETQRLQYRKGVSTL